MNKALLRYVFADGMAVLADNYFFVFLALAAAQSGANPAQIGLLLAVYAIPRLIFLLPGGLIADKFSPRIIMTAGNAIQATGMAILGLSFASGDVSLSLLFAVAVSFGIVDAFNLPAVTAAPVRLVARDKLFKANRLRDGVGSTFQTLGFFLPGLVATLLGADATAWIGCMMYCISAGLFASVHFASGHSEEAVEKKLLDGIKYAWRSRSIRVNLLLQAVVYFATFGPLIVGLLLFLEAQKFSPIVYSLVLVAYSIGGILGAVFSARFEHTRRRGLVLLTEIPLIAIVLGLMALTANILFLYIGFAILGAYSIVTGVISDTWRQHETKNNLQGRVGGVKVLIVELAKTTSRSVTGFMVIILGLSETLWVSAVAIVVFGILLVAIYRQLLLNNQPAEAVSHY